MAASNPDGILFKGMSRPLHLPVARVSRGGETGEIWLCRGATVEQERSQQFYDRHGRRLILEVIEALALCDEWVNRVGTKEYFEFFYDVVPHGEYGGLYPNSLITDDEEAAILEVRHLLDEAYEIPGYLPEAEFIATGWPARIQPVAKHAVDVMLRRGRMSDDEEEPDPSPGAVYGP